MTKIRPYTNVRVTRCHQITLFLNTKKALAAKRIQGVTLGNPKVPFKKVNLIKIVRKLRSYSRSDCLCRKLQNCLGTKTTQLSTPTLTKESYSIPDGTWLHERLYRAHMKKNYKAWKELTDYHDWTS